MSTWIKQIDLHSNEDVIKMLVGAKCDLDGDRKVQKDQAEKFATKYGMEFMEVSAKTSLNVEEVFEKLAREINKKRDEIQKEIQAGGLNLN